MDTWIGLTASLTYLHFARSCLLLSEDWHRNILKESLDILQDRFRGKIRVEVEQSLGDQHVGVRGELVSQPTNFLECEDGLV